MPVTSISGSLSTSLYFASMFLLLFVLANPLTTAYKDADLRAAEQISSGLSMQIDELAPGMVSSLALASQPGLSISARISGGEVTVTVNGQSSVAPLKWDVEDVTLVSGEHYEVTVESAPGAGEHAALSQLGYLEVVEIAP